MLNTLHPVPAQPPQRVDSQPLSLRVRVCICISEAPTISEQSLNRPIFDWLKTGTTGLANVISI